MDVTASSRDQRERAAARSACAWTSSPPTWPTPRARARRKAGPYKRRDVVLRGARPASDFDDILGAEARPAAVRVARVVEDETPPRVVFDPGHPDADAEGYVAYPNVNPVTEMVDLMAATRAYEANVAAVNATKRVLEAALVDRTA